MEQVHRAKEAAQAEAGECATSSARNPEKKGILKKILLQVQGRSDGKLGPAPKDFAYV